MLVSWNRAGVRDIDPRNHRMCYALRQGYDLSDVNTGDRKGGGMAKLTDGLTPAQKKEAAGVLTRALKTVSVKHNWIQGGIGVVYENTSCALGHISRAEKLGTSSDGFGGSTITLKYPQSNDPAVLALFDALPPGVIKDYDDVNDSVIDYNDKHGRTHKAVVRWFQRALDLVRE